MKQTFHDKLKKILEAIPRTAKPGVMYIEIRHDDNCPALKTGSLFDCNCNCEVEKVNEA